MDSIAKNKNDSFWIVSSIIVLILSIETLNKEIKFLITEKHELNDDKIYFISIF